MSETQLPWGTNARFVKVICSLGLVIPDGVDADRSADLTTQGGKVTIVCNATKVRLIPYGEPGRMLSIPSTPFTIAPATGELFDTQGVMGLYVLDPMSGDIDPQGFTYTATVVPNVGSPWSVTFGGNSVLPDVVDLVRLASIAPATGVSTLEQRIEALEADTGSGAYPVQQVSLTGNIAYTLPVDAPTDQVISVVFTQDGIGGHTVTYNDNPVTVGLAAGALTLVELHPDGWCLVTAIPSAAVVQPTKTLTNLVPNPSFTDNLAGWVSGQASSATIARTSSGELEITATATPTFSANALSTGVPAGIIGHVYYYRSKVRIASARRARVNYSGKVALSAVIQPNVDTYWSTTLVPTASSAQLIVQMSDSAVVPAPGEKFYADDILLLDLTAEFGAGNEPTKAAMDAAVEGATSIVGQFVVNWGQPLGSSLRQARIATLDNIQEPSSRITVAIMGDSQIEQTDLCSQIAAKSGATVINLGIGGTRVTTAGAEGSHYIPLSGVSLATAISTQDWSAQDNAVAALLPDDNSAALARMKAVNWAEVDAIVLAWGTNDFIGGIGIGDSASSDKTKMWPAVNYVIQTLAAKAPQAQIVTLTPVFRSRQALGDGLNSDDNAAPGGVTWMKDYAAAIASASAANHTPCLDLHAVSGINKQTASLMLMDGLHYSTAGADRVAHIVAEWLGNN